MTTLDPSPPTPTLNNSSAVVWRMDPHGHQPHLAPSPIASASAPPTLNFKRTTCRSLTGQVGQAKLFLGAAVAEVL